MNVNSSTKCKLGTVTATGTFRMVANGPGGTVYYHWTRHDSNGTVVMPTNSYLISPGDPGTAHFTVTDTWTPASSGWEQLVFTTPGYAVAPQSWTCRP